MIYKKNVDDMLAELLQATEKWFAPAVIDQIFSQNPLAGRLKEMSSA